MRVRLPTLGARLAPALVLALVAFAAAPHLRSSACVEGRARRAPLALARQPASWNFDEDDLRTMLARARSAVGIAVRDGEAPLATGVRIAPDLVLTCRHATIRDLADGSRRAPGDLAVWIDHTDASGMHPPARMLPVVAYAHTSRTADWCVLRLAVPATRVTSDTSDTPPVGTAPLDGPGRVKPGMPVYVVHHGDGAPRRLHDGGVVRFPYRVDALTRGGLLAAWPREAARLARDYRMIGEDAFEHVSSRWARQPTLSLATTLPSGASGAPVFCKRTHRLLGIVFAGDHGDPRRAKRELRDAVVPLEVILRELRSAGLTSSTRHE